MAKVIRLNEFKKKAQNIKSQKEYLPYEDVDEINEKLRLLPFIVDEVFLCIEESLTNAEFDVGSFRLSSRADVMDMNISEFFAGGEEALVIAFESNIKGTNYCAVGSAMVDGEEVSFDCDIVKWDGEEWLALADGDWVQGPGADFI